MNKITPFVKKIALAVLVLAIGLAALPSISASAAGLDSQTATPATPPTYPRVVNAWARAQTAYLRQGDRLAKAETFISKVQTLIDKATQKGFDTTAVEAALNAFSVVIPAAQAAHDNGAAIIANHAGFDADGNVTDRPTAIDTVKALVQVLKDTRTAMNGTGKALREAIKAFRDANKH